MKKMLMALSLSSALLGGSAVVWAEEAASTPVTEQTVAASDAVENTCEYCT
jgi:Amt family ammonium transporter